ncbi:MAG: pyrroline-5-carboxylate reductase [Planctomycetota bacterium]
MRLPHLAFIGGGNMATAIIAGLRKRDQVPDITVCDPVAAVRERHAAAGCRVSDQIPEAAQDRPVVILAVKPQQAEAVLTELRPAFGKDQLLISILAGTRCERLESGLQPGARVVRAMPNTPMAVGAGMVGLCAGSAATDADCRLAEAIFAGAATVLRTTEDRMDALTAISGSGPAYLFHYCEAMQAAAIDLGFSPEEAALLVGTTVQGSIRYLLSHDGFPADRLREQVTSPGGTTAAALAVFEQRGFLDMVQEAVRAAQRRGRELSA